MTFKLSYYLYYSTLIRVSYWEDDDDADNDEESNITRKICKLFSLLFILFIQVILEVEMCVSIDMTL